MRIPLGPRLWLPSCAVMSGYKYRPVGNMQCNRFSEIIHLSAANRTSAQLVITWSIKDGRDSFHVDQYAESLVTITRGNPAASLY
mmetsp:Transcript_91239/g.158190  ORF Transcript_91239/g.158190 Transcript_91239/m.158190 type:complete len:85 (-) Transcript_91239:102-356(-)